MRNFVTELSELPRLGSDQGAFLVHVSHQLDGKRINAGPFLEVADGPNAHESVKDWIFKDPAVVDYNLRPLSKEDYNFIRRKRAIKQIFSTAIYYTALRSEASN